MTVSIYLRVRVSWKLEKMEANLRPRGALDIRDDEVCENLWVSLRSL